MQMASKHKGQHFQSNWSNILCCGKNEHSQQHIQSEMCTLTITVDFQPVNKMVCGNGEVNQHRVWENFFMGSFKT